MKPRGRAFVLPPEYRELEDAYAADLQRLGFQVNSTWRWGARAFCVRFGDGAGWDALSLMEQSAPGDEVTRDHPSLSATPRHVADGNEDRTQVGARPAKRHGRGQEWLQDCPLCVA